MISKFSLYWDGYGLDAPNSGIFVHARNIASELVLAGCRPRLVGLNAALKSFPDLEGFAPLAGPLTRRLPRNKLFWSRGVRRRIEEEGREDDGTLILHGLSNFNIPRKVRKNWRRVLTVHDLIPILAPKEVSTPLYLQLKYLLPSALRSADQIVCVSNWTKRTLIEFMPAVEGKIVVIPNGVGAVVAAGRSKDEDRSRINLLFVSRFEHYKGHSTLVDLLKSSKLPLVLTVITDTRGCEFWQSRAAELITKGKVRVQSSVYGDELRRCYEKADVYVSPSRFEGYCLPAVEALSAGTPVVYLGGSGIDEVAGSSVSFKVENPLKISAWEDAISQAKLESARQDYALRALEYLQKLPTWKDAADDLLRLYNKLV